MERGSRESLSSQGVTLPVRLTSDAERDLLLATGWYLREAPHMVTSFEEEIDSSFRRIASQPRMYQVVEANVRRSTVHRFPFSVFYRTLPDRIEVIGVLHQSRDPGNRQLRA